MTYGVTDDGFILKPFSVIRAEVEDYQRQHIHAALNHLDDSVISQLNLSHLNQVAELWQQAAAVYSSQYPDTASGFSLVQTCAITGTLPNSWQKTLVLGRVTMNPNRALPAGSVAHLDDLPSVRFVTMVEVPAAPAGGVFEVLFEAEQAGSTQVAIGQLNTIAQPVSGWTAVTNLVEGDPGSEPETDDELRLKRERELAASGSANLDAILADVSRVDGVVDASAEENVLWTFANGMKPHSIRVTVRGGDDDEISRAIFLSRAAGIGTNGNAGVPQLDSQGELHEVLFRRAVEKVFYAAVTLLPGEGWDIDTEANVKTLLAGYVNGLRLGSTIQHDRCLCAIYGEPAVASVSSLLIGFSAPPASAADLQLAADEYSTADTLNISITVL